MSEINSITAPHILVCIRKQSILEHFSTSRVKLFVQQGMEVLRGQTKLV